MLYIDNDVPEPLYLHTIKSWRNNDGRKNRRIRAKD